MSHTSLADRPDTRPRLRITNPRRIAGGQLVGAFDQVFPSGVVWLGCKLFNSAGTFWVKPPDCIRVDRDGRAALKPDGKRIYDDIITFTTTERRNSWRDQTLAAIALDAPDLLSSEPLPTEPSATPARGAAASQRPRDGHERLTDDEIPF